ncbi:hypothetical protein SRABI13_01666 [Erwinia aphidicola]|nr:hypothetical protein SRABI13_01666 [Erwinia aphidicola]
MINMQVTGLAELERKLIELGKKAGTKVLRDAGRAALAVVEEDMKQNAGYDNTAAGPHMRDSIKIRSTTRARGNAVVVLRVGPSKQHYIKALAQDLARLSKCLHPLFARHWITTRRKSFAFWRLKSAIAF